MQWKDLGIESAFYINLERRPERHLAMQRQLHSLGLKPIRFAAYDGSCQSAVSVLSDQPVLNKPTQVACAYSHLHLWRELLTHSTQEMFLILEDDCRLAPRLPDDLDRRQWPTQWEIMQLGCSHPYSLQRLLQMHALGVPAVRWEPPGWGTFAYLVKRSCLQILVNRFLPSGNTLCVVGYHRPDKVTSDALLFYDTHSYSLSCPLATTSDLGTASDIGYASGLAAVVAQAESMTLHAWRDRGLLSEGDG